MKKNKISRALALVCMFALLVGSLAYFSDRVDNSDSPLAFELDDEGIDIRPVDPSTDPDEVPDPTDNPGQDIKDIWDANNDGSIENEDVYPGKDIDLDFDLVNASDSAVDVRETIVLTVKDYKGDALNLSSTPEYQLFESAVDDTYGAMDGVNVISVETVNANTVKYVIAPYVIDGKNEDIDGVAGIDNRISRSYSMVMNKLAKNAFQASTCQIDYLMEVKQHAENGPTGGWTDVVMETVTLGGVDVQAVPEAAVAP